MKNGELLKELKKYLPVWVILFILLVILMWTIITSPPTFTIKKEGREKFEFFTRYVHYFGSNYVLDGVKHVMIASAGAVVVSVKKDGRFVVYKIKESEVITEEILRS